MEGNTTTLRRWEVAEKLFNIERKKEMRASEADTVGAETFQRKKKGEPLCLSIIPQSTRRKEKEAE